MPSSRKKTLWLQSVPVHSLLFAIYPVIALLAFNTTEVEFSSGLRPLFLSLLVAAVLMLVFYWIYRDWRRAALITTLLLILFYSYGHSYILLKGIRIGEFYLFRH